MTTNPPPLKEQAKQGNISAIAILLNIALKPKKITAKASIDGSCLRLMLESQPTPDSEICLRIIYREIVNLKPDFIKTVRIFAKNSQEDFVEWSQEINLEKTINSNTNNNEEVPEFIKTLKRFKFGDIVPYKEALNSELYQTNLVKILLFFSLFPWLMSFLSRSAGLENIAWLLGIYYAFIWGIILKHLIKPSDFSWGDTIKCSLFTIFFGIPFLLICQRLPPFNILYTGIENSSLIPRLTGSILGVGILEETCKALPIYLFLLRSRQLKDPHTAAFYGSMSGLGFAIAEGVQYSVHYALGLKVGQLQLGTYIIANTIRFISLPLFHAIWAGIVGYFIGMAALNPSKQKAIIILGICIAAILHGSYNTFSETLLGFLILGFSILLFVAYLRRSKQMAELLNNQWN